ncbi:hypothetical protein AVEN_158774-1 [Araneus ventricosus]|uniref:Uncharacterized protein n=1 Tax=Araneus ventricosus TaxID=182803 RepID=A0A4Y2WKS3_ARAVE|nr:hypothetical protein AVEN_158774-1 [Araneus ventricosus]
MYHPSNGLRRTTNTWGYVAVHEKQEANRVATSFHGELPRLPSREGRKKQKLKERKNQKGDQTLGYLGVMKPVTSTEDVPLRGQRKRKPMKRTRLYLMVAPLLIYILPVQASTNGCHSTITKQWLFTC